MVREGRKGSGNQFITLDGKKRLATVNLVPSSTVYGERLIIIDGIEYRTWDPFRSKLAAGVLKGLRNFPFVEGVSVLYLGVSTGTTASHLSDIVGEEGVIYGVEFAHRVMREFVDRVAKNRINVIPIVEDARRPERYFHLIGKVDVVYCDIAQADQTEIAMSNCRKHLNRGGYLILVVKARSIDVTRTPKQLFRKERQKLKKNDFEVEQMVELDPFDRDHAMISARWRNKEDH